MMLWTYKHAYVMVAYYRKAFEHLLSHPKATVRTAWSHEPVGLDDFRAEFLDALNKRINLKATPARKIRKLDPIYQLGLMRDRNRLADIRRRIRVYQFETPEITARFGDRLARYDD